MRLTFNHILCFSLAISLSFVSSAWARGLRVEPGKINIRNVPLGKKVAVSELGGDRMKLKINNKSDSAYTFTIDILSTHEAAATLKEGYTDIPDKSWVWPEDKEVRIEGNSARVVELYLNIPKREENYNKGYQAIIEVKSKQRPGEIFVLACQLKMCFSTQAEEKEKQQVEDHKSLENKELEEPTGTKSLEKKGVGGCERKQK